VTNTYCTTTMQMHLFFVEVLLLFSKSRFHEMWGIVVAVVVMQQCIIVVTVMH
jgi:hypothetical protein